MPLFAIKLSTKLPASSSLTHRKSSSPRRAPRAPFPPRNSRKLPAIMPRVFPCSPMPSALSNTLSRKPRPKTPFSSPALSIWSASSATIGSSARKSPRVKKHRRISLSGLYRTLAAPVPARHSLLVGAQHAAPLLRQPRFKRLANIMKTKGKRPTGDGKGVITHPLVGIIMGSGSDWDTMKFTSKTLGELGVPHETRVVSAHRTPDLLFKYASNAEKRGIEVIIAGAGGPAPLPGLSRRVQCRTPRGRHPRCEASRHPRSFPKTPHRADRPCPRQPGSLAVFSEEEREARVTIGILGGGQLGYMLALAGYPLGLHFRFLDPSPEAPVGRIAQRVTADYTDQAALEKFSSGLELVTYEFENVPVEAARFLAQRVPVYPPPPALEAAQDRLAEKDLFRKLGIATTEFAPVSNPSELDAAVKTLGLPAVLKTSRMGYDGKGQWILRTFEDVAKARSELPPVKLILERFVPFTRELSVLAVRSRNGVTAIYPR